jgi:hypothetical protein
MHYFSYLFCQDLYMIRKDLLSSILVWQIPITVNTVLRLLMMDSKSVRNM